MDEIQIDMIAIRAAIASLEIRVEISIVVWILLSVPHDYRLASSAVVPNPNKNQVIFEHLTASRVITSSLFYTRYLSGSYSKNNNWNSPSQTQDNIFTKPGKLRLKRN